MPSTKSNNKKRLGPLTKGSLLAHCRARGLSVSQLARQIGKSRMAVYYAVEKPDRFTPTYNLILQTLK